MALKMRAWLLAALVVLAAAVALPAVSAADPADPDTNGETQALNNESTEVSASGEAPPVQSGSTEPPVSDSAATGAMDDSEESSVEEASGTDAPAPSGAPSAPPPPPPSTSTTSEEPKPESDADEEVSDGAGASVPLSSNVAGPGSNPVPTTSGGTDEASSDGSEPVDSNPLDSSSDAVENNANADPEGGLDPTMDESSEPVAEPNATALARDGTPAPHPTVAYNNRTEYQGFEYAGPVVHARHAVLDTKAKCGLYGNPSTVFTFDNRGFAFRGLGAFVMARVPSTGEEVQVLQTRTPLPQAIPRTVGVAIRAPTGQVVQVRFARAPGTPASEASLRPYVTLNGLDLTARVESQPRVDTEAFEITRDGAFGAAKPMLMAVRVAGSGTTVAITFERTVGVNHLNVFVEVDGSRMGTLRGLCGNYDYNPANDVLTTSSGGAAVASAAKTASAQAVRDAKKALFEGYAVPSEAAVVPEPLQPVHMHATEADTAAAERACAMLRRDFQRPCVMSALVAGAEGVAEVKGTQDILLENSVVATVNASDCFADFFLGPWTQYGQCDSPCGAGASNRTREVYSGKTREQCATLTQFRRCTTKCEHANVPGKCAVYGDPHVVTFDQRMYDFRGVGEYVMYHSLDDKEQVNVVLDRTITNRTSQVSWATGMAFRAGPDVFSLHLPDAGDDFCSIRYNGRALGGLSANVSYYGLFTVRRTGRLAGPHRSSMVVEVSAPGGTTVTAAFYSFGAGVASLMNVFLEVGGQRLKDTQGLCGSFDLDPANDLTDVDGKAVKPREFAWGWGVARNRTLFADPTPALALPASRLPLAPRLIGANGTYEAAVNACTILPPQLREACVIDYVTLGPEAIQMMKDVDVVVEEDKVTVEYVARGCLVQEGSYLGPWGDWSDCSRDCNGGEQTRSRGIFAYNSERCGTEGEKRQCNQHPCPIDCEVGTWRNWAECSVSCGNGTETRTRGITVPAQHGGDHCPPLSESRACERLPCCEVGEWDSFSECRPDGTKIRRRAVNYPARCGKTTDVAACCYADPWPVSSHTVNGTGAKGAGGGEPLWTECVDGRQTRRRRVFPEHCAEAEQHRPCCDTGRWSNWGQCQDGAQTRWRTVSPSNCSHSSETRVCCTQYAWSSWSSCSAGKRNRTRSVAPSGCDTTSQVEDCCSFGNWTADEKVGCVRGEQRFTRLVEPKSCGKAAEVRPCCSTEEWGEWGECKNRTQVRERGVFGPENCAPSNETRACEAPEVAFAKAVDAAVAAKLKACGCHVCPCAAAAAPAPAPQACGCASCPCADAAAPADGTVRPATVKSGTLRQQQLQ